MTKGQKHHRKIPKQISTPNHPASFMGLRPEWGILINMKYNPKIHNRRSIRLKGYDYSQAGLYYITICVQNRECLFGKIVRGQPQGIAPTRIAPTGIAPTMQLNDAGKMVKKEWINIPNRFPQIQLHEFIVMPNHFHAIMEIVGASLVGAQNRAGAQNTAHTQMGKNIWDGENQNNQSKIEYGRSSEKGRPQGCAPTGSARMGFAPTGGNETVGDMVGAFKSITTNEYIDGVKNHNWPRFNGKLWQRNYWEHIIRNEESYQRISDYIINNPLNWADDKFYRS